MYITVIATDVKPDSWWNTTTLHLQLNTDESGQPEFFRRFVSDVKSKLKQTEIIQFISLLVGCNKTYFCFSYISVVWSVPAA